MLGKKGAAGLCTEVGAVGVCTKMGAPGDCTEVGAGGGVGRLRMCAGRSGGGLWGRRGHVVRQGELAFHGGEWWIWRLRCVGALAQVYWAEMRAALRV